MEEINNDGDASDVKIVVAGRECIVRVKNLKSGMETSFYKCSGNKILDDHEKLKNQNVSN